jgi:hypothetical protein
MVWVVVFSELWHYVVLYVVTNISNEFAAAVLRIEAKKLKRVSVPLERC